MNCLYLKIPKATIQVASARNVQLPLPNCLIVLLVQVCLTHMTFGLSLPIIHLYQGTNHVVWWVIPWGEIQALSAASCGIKGDKFFFYVRQCPYCKVHNITHSQKRVIKCFFSRV
jgi:hypothetical protein